MSNCEHWQGVESDQQVVGNRSILYNRVVTGLGAGSVGEGNTKLKDSSELEDTDIRGKKPNKRQQH